MFAYDAYYTENKEFRGYEKNVVEFFYRKPVR